MAPRGTLSDAGPNACPFVALELDRDRRSERPDYRHRCYAEQVPAPRTIAHQERYCLSPNFSGCPIFQDWAVRAAARPVPLPQGHEGGRRATPDPRVAGAAGAAGAASAAALAGAAVDQPDQPVSEEVWPDSMATSLPVAGEPVVEEQLSAFDSPPIDRVASAPPPKPAPSPTAPPSPYSRPTNGIPIGQSTGIDRVIREMDDEVVADSVDTKEPDDAAVPAFLASRSTRPRRSPKPDDRVEREDLVPSWEIDGRFGAQAGREPRGDGVFGRLLTMVAVVIILALGVAAVILVPGLLAGGPQQTTRPSFANLATRSPSASASGLAVVPTSTEIRLSTASPKAQPTTAGTPEPSPRPYKIKAGDTLAKIARRFRIAVSDILAANPQIPDADHIEVGQLIVIPLPVATPAP